ncbi:hypothetical protein [Micromonospora fulviviridis]|uniref:Uncharacterized protein n=1 Tax=Micromonospora fulviviridis TaxID=47860 RepID=A0ABV2VCY0_9ACTN
MIISDLAVAWAPLEDEMVNNDPSSRQRERKRAIRTRMRLTGETYVVAARRHDKEVARVDARRLPVVRCPQCPEGMVDIDETPACRACGATWDSGQELATEYADVFLGLGWYSSIKDGGDAPTRDCPDCGEQSVVTIQPDDVTFWTMMCVSCATSYNDSCTRCGAPIQHREEGDLLVCADCWHDRLGRD